MPARPAAPTSSIFDDLYAEENGVDQFGTRAAGGFRDDHRLDHDGHRVVGWMIAPMSM